MSLIVFLVLLLNLSSLNDAARILILSPASSKSHSIATLPFAEALANKGHQVTIVTAYPSNRTITNLREIIVPNVLEKYEEDMDLFKSREKGEFFVLMKFLTDFGDIFKEAYNNLQNSVPLQEYLQSRQVDLIVLDAILNEFCLPIIDHLKIPFIYYSPMSGAPWTLEAMGASLELASVPVSTEPSTNQMTFFQRMRNTLAAVVASFARQRVLLPVLDQHVQKDFPNSRSIAEIERDASLCIINIHPTTAWPRSLPPTVIPVGPLHVRPAQPLPEDFQNLADGCKEHGFILFSLGSIIKSTTIPKTYLDAFINVFSKLPQCVLWKWEDANHPKVSPNIFFVKWLPQQDLLGHPNIRLLIAHGGLLSLQEAIYHAVPILALPIGNDQVNNMAKAEKDGIGIKLNWDHLNEASLYQSITTIMNNSSYSENAQRLSHLLRDDLIPAKEAAVYWVEHVIKHKGTEHLKMSSKDMPFYQVYLLDIIAFFLLLTAVVCFIEWNIIKWIYRRFQGENKKKKD